MKRVIVFCPRLWTDPFATANERFVHEVFSRIASAGHYVAWICREPPRAPWVDGAPAVESIDNIQVARLGTWLTHRMMVRALLRRIAKPDRRLMLFDVAIECVDGRPIPVSRYVETSVIPLVFRLTEPLRAQADPPGPVIVPTRIAREQVIRSGIPEDHIVSAPFGADSGMVSPGGRATVAKIVATGRETGTLTRALRYLARAGKIVDADLQMPPRFWARLRAPTLRDATVTTDEVWMWYCGVGNEWDAVSAGSRGIPAFARDTAAGCEAIEDTVTGFVHRRGDAKQLAEQIDSLISDEVLYRRIASQARERATARTWERTVGLVLAAIENLLDS